MSNNYIVIPANSVSFRSRLEHELNMGPPSINDCRLIWQRKPWSLRRVLLFPFVVLLSPLFILVLISMKLCYNVKTKSFT